MTDIVERLHTFDWRGPRRTATAHEAADTITTLRAEVAALREGLAVSCEKMETTLAAMDKYNADTGMHIIGQSLLSLLSLRKQIAANRALLETNHAKEIGL